MFEESFQRIVVAAANRDAELRDYPGVKRCGRGHGPFNSATSVLCYCLCYQRTHFESLEAILERHPVLDRFPRPAIIDIGAGPGTVPLAIAQRHRRRSRRPISLRYVDIEHSRWMRRIATEYLDDHTLFAEVERTSFSSILDIDMEEVGELTADADVMIVALSFVLNQRDVSDEFVTTVVDLIDEVDAMTTMPVYLLIQDASGGFDRHNAFFADLRRKNVELDGYSGRITQPHRQALLDGTVPQQAAATARNVAYWLGRVTRLA